MGAITSTWEACLGVSWGGREFFADTEAGWLEEDPGR